MRYKSLKVQNFKGIKEIEIDFSFNRILTLVGLNESGKTTILEAINRFYFLLKDKKMTAQELNEIRPKGIDFTGNIVLSGTLEFEEKDYAAINNYLTEAEKKTKLIYPKEFSYTYSFKYEVHSYKSVAMNVGFTAKSNSKTKDNLHKTNNTLWNELVVYIRQNLIPEILYYEDFIFEIPDRITFNIAETEETKKLVNASQKEWKLVFDDILKTIGTKFTTFQENVVNIWESDNDTARQRLSAMEKQLDKKITNSWKELFDENQSKENQRLNFREIKLLPISQDDDKISFSFKVKTESGKEFSLNERSKGCKWFFSFLIFTEFRKNRTSNILFLLDEPASNLHSSAQLKILNAINSLSDKSVIVYSTHSHHLINPIWLNGAYVVINEGMSTSNLEGALTDTDAKITIDKYYNYVSKGKQEIQTLYFQPILDRLDYKPSFIDPLPSLIICEGKNDWYTLKYINEIVLQNKYTVNLYPGKGANSNTDILRLYLSWGNTFLLLLDGDDQGIKSKDKYIDELGNIVADKIYTYKDILNKKIVTEDIFSEKDKEIICDTAFGEKSYQNLKANSKKLKSTFNFAISQLLISKTTIELDKLTIDTFIKIFDFLKLKL